MAKIELQKLTFSDSEAFWRRVNRLIKEKNTTQEYICSIIGVHFGTFRAWSSGKIYPKLGDIFTLAQALDTSVNYLIFGTKTEPIIHTEYIIGKKVLDLIEIIKKAVD